jgi:hypothetical protein
VKPLSPFSQDTAKISSIKTLLEVSGSGSLGEQAVQNMFASSFLVDMQQWFEYRRTGHPVLPKGAG